MKALKNRLNNQRTNFIAKVIGASLAKERKRLSLEVNAATPFEKSLIKDYAIEETIHFDNFDVLLDIFLDDYGFCCDGALERDVDESSELTLEIDRVYHETASVIIKGQLYGDLLFASTLDPTAEFLLYGIKEGRFENLKVHQALAYEAYVVEERKQSRLSFFSYFMAIESYANRQLQMYVAKVHKELHYAIEHLGLDEKIKIVCKEALDIAELGSVELWGEFMGRFKEAKDLRNKIAHGREKVAVSGEDLNAVVFCLCVLIAICEEKATSFTDVRRYIA